MILAELKENKDKAHKLNLEVGAAKAETESYKKRISQLEDKIISKEKEKRYHTHNRREKDWH